MYIFKVFLINKLYYLNDVYAIYVYTYNSRSCDWEEVQGVINYFLKFTRIEKYVDNLFA